MSILKRHAPNAPSPRQLTKALEERGYVSLLQYAVKTAEAKEPESTRPDRSAPVQKPYRERLARRLMPFLFTIMITAWVTVWLTLAVIKWNAGYALAGIISGIAFSVICYAFLLVCDELFDF